MDEGLVAKTVTARGGVVAGEVPVPLMVGAGGVLACCFHGSLGILFLWAAVIGIGIGMVAPVAPALINENLRYKGDNAADVRVCAAFSGIKRTDMAKQFLSFID